MIPLYELAQTIVNLSEEEIEQNKVLPKLKKKKKAASKFPLNTGLNIFSKTLFWITGSEITLTNNEIKYMIKLSRSLENRRTLLKGTTNKILVKSPLMRVGLPLKIYTYTIS